MRTAEKLVGPFVNLTSMSDVVQTDLLWLPRRVLPGRNFAAGLIELCFNLIGYFKLLLEVILNPLADLLDFLTRQLWNRRLDFFHCAHTGNLTEIFPMRREKKGWG